MVAANSAPAETNEWLRLPPEGRSVWMPVTVLFVLALLIHSRMLLAPDWIAFYNAEAWRLKNWSYRYPYLMEQFAEAFRQGIWYPRWLPELMGGYGYPSFVFYQPGLFYAALPWVLMTGSAIIALKITLVLIFVIGGLGAYRLACLFGTHTQALIAACLFLLAPYLLVDLYVRAVYSEIFAIMLSPWCAYFMLRVHLARMMHASYGKYIFGWIISVTLMIAAHPFVTLHVLTALGIIGLGVWAEEKWNHGFPILCILGFICSLALASPYLLTLVVMKHAIQYELGLFVYFQGLIPLVDILMANPVSNLMMVVALWYGRSNPVIRGVAAAWAWILFAISAESQPVWQHLEPLRFTQLPSRLLSADMLLRLMGQTLALRLIAQKLVLYGRVTRITVISLVVTALVAASLFRPIPHPPTDRTSFSLLAAYAGLHDMDYAVFRNDMKQRFEDMTYKHEFTPRSANLATFAQTHIPFGAPLAAVVIPGGATLDAAPDNTPFHLHYHLTVTSVPSAGGSVDIGIRQLYMEGWNVTVNGMAMDPVPEHATPQAPSPWAWGPQQDGTLRVQFFSPGEYDVRAWYDGPVGWQWRNAMIVAVLVVCGFGLRYVYCSRKSMITGI